jgi:hypothetical protein
MNPVAIVIASNGDVYIDDTDAFRIRKVSGGTISTYAGIGTSGYNGDGMAATLTQLSHSTGLSIDPNNIVYLSDQSSNRVRKISAAGILSTVAGPGPGGFTGDGGAATSASLATPGAVAVARDGSIFITDENNYRIRRVFPNGTMSTYAGSGTSSFTGDGGPATSATMTNPVAVAVDESDGTVIFGECSGNRARIVYTNGTITTFAGTGSGTFGAMAVLQLRLHLLARQVLPSMLHPTFSSRTTLTIVCA